MKKLKSLFNMRVFIKRCRKNQEGATPDVLDKVLSTDIVKENEMRIGRRYIPILISSCAVCFVLGLSIFTGMFLLRNPINKDHANAGNTSVTTQSPAQNIPVTDPSVRKNVVVRALSLNTFSSYESGLEKSIESIGENLYLQYSNLNDQSLVSTQFVYDIKGKKVMDLFSVVKSRLISEKIIDENDDFEFYNYDSKYVLYDGINVIFRNNKKSYYYNFEKKKLIALPVDIALATANVQVTKDFSHYLLSATNTSWNQNYTFPIQDIFFVNIETGTITNLAKNKSGEYKYQSKGFTQLSPTGRYAIFDLGDDASYGKRVLYDTQTHKGSVFKGGIAKFSDNDDYAFILGDDKGNYKMNCQTGEITKLTPNDKPRDSIRINDFFYIDVNYLEGYEKKVIIRDLRTNEEEVISDKLISAYVIDKQQNFICYYIDKSKTVECIDIVTKERFKIDVNEAFLNDVENTRGNNLMIYGMYTNDENTELMLTYSMQIKPQKR